MAAPAQATERVNVGGLTSEWDSDTRRRVCDLLHDTAHRPSGGAYKDRIGRSLLALTMSIDPDAFSGQRNFDPTIDEAELGLALSALPTDHPDANLLLETLGYEMIQAPQASADYAQSTIPGL